jgi:hypothetical protein
MFYFKICFIITNKYNTTFIPFVLCHYIFKRWENIIYIYITMLILNMFIYKSLYENKEMFLVRYHYCSNVWNSEDSTAFSRNLLDIFVNFFL